MAPQRLTLDGGSPHLQSDAHTNTNIPSAADDERPAHTNMLLIAAVCPLRIPRAVERAVRVSIFPYERVFELFEQRSVDAHAELLDRALAARNDDRSVIIRNALRARGAHQDHAEK